MMNEEGQDIGILDINRTCTILRMMHMWVVSHSGILSLRLTALSQYNIYRLIIQFMSRESPSLIVYANPY
jgi:hypothetical protein